jgi:phenylacetate-CoA ligase
MAMVEALDSGCELESANRLDRLNALLSHTWKHNAFYRNKWQRAAVSGDPLGSVEELGLYPFTTRAELIEDQAAHPPLGRNLAGPVRHFTRLLHSSGTTRSPILWADTPRSWEWVAQCSAELHAITGVREQDVMLLLADLGSTSGPWVILEGARRVGGTCLTCGRHDVNEAYHWLCSMHPNVLVGKPEPLLMFAMAVRAHGLCPSVAGIERLILTGPGSSIHSSSRDELEECWDAPCFDRYGMTEAGSVAAECVAHAGALHVLDGEFIAEVIDPSSLDPIEDGRMGELVLTNLGRIDRPIIRYRTGDRVTVLRNHHCSCGRVGTVISDGVQGRLH